MKEKTEAEKRSAKNGQALLAEDEKEQKEAQDILRVIESLLASNEQIIGICKKCKKASALDLLGHQGDEALAFRRISKRIIRHYSDRSAVSGAASTLSGLLPGLGSLTAFVGGAAVDVIMTLKFEIEMTLCLCHLAGFDIEDERDRRLAFSLACVSVYEVKVSDSPIVDKLSLAAAAFWDYSLRQLSKYTLQMLAKILVLSSAKSLTRAIPLLGLVVCSSVNKVLTQRTGQQIAGALWARKTRYAKPAQKHDNDEVFEANFIDDAEQNPEADGAREDEQR